MSTILIVEDHAMSREALKTLLSYYGHRLLEAVDGSAALELARAEHPELIITDIVMPTMDGIEFVRQLRAEKGLKKMPVIFYTATYRIQEARKLVEGFSECYVIPKPSEPSVILQTVNEILGISPPEAALPPVTGVPFSASKYDPFRCSGIQLATLIDLGFHLVSQRDPSRLLDIFCSAVSSLLNCRYVRLTLLEDNGRERCFGEDKREAKGKGRRAKGKTKTKTGQDIPPCRLTLDPSDIEQVVSQRRTIRRYHTPGGSSAQSFMAVPFATPDRVYGWFCLAGKVDSAPFSEQEEEMADSLGSQAALAYENIMLLKEQQRRAGELQKSEERFRSAMESMLDGFAIFSAIRDSGGRVADFRFEYINGAGCMMNRRTSEEQVGHTLLELLPAHRDTGLFDKYVAVVETGQPFNEELFYEDTYGNGVKINRGFDVRAVKLGDGFAATWRDITERKQAEDALRMKDAAIATSISGVAFADLEEKITYVNDSFLRMWGYNSDEVIGRHPNELCKNGEDAVNAFKQIKSSGSWRGEVIALKKDGSTFPVEISATLVKDADGNPICLMASFNDITERKNAEENIRNLNEELSARNTELEAFIYSVSHDLRAPLRTISGFVKMLIEDYAGRLDGQGRDYLDRINKGSGNMNILIDDLLRLSRVSRQEFGRTNINMSDMAASIIAGLRETGPGRRVEFFIAEGLTVFADRRLMEIVLSNLLGNAWKFTSKTGHARIEFGVMQEEISHTGLIGPVKGPVYFVRDNGAGFDPAYADKMFRPFNRLHSEKEFEGTGIGLAIVERIIRRHGGKVWAEGEAGKGATVFFTIPAT